MERVQTLVLGAGVAWLVEYPLKLRLMIDVADYLHSFFWVDYR